MEDDIGYWRAVGSEYSVAIEDDIGHWQYFESGPQMALSGPEVTSLGRWVGGLGEVV